MQLQYMKPIPAGTTPKVLMLGNGIHRAFESVNFTELLKEISERDFAPDEWDYLIDKVPFPLLAVIASKDSVGMKMRNKGEEMAAQQIPEDEIKLLSILKDKHLDAILTTDYTYEIDHALIPEFKCKPKVRCKYRFTTCKEKPKKETDALYTYMGVPEHSIPPIWHIHGEAARPDTMVLGHYDYGSLMGHIRTYIAQAVKRYKISEKNGTEFYPRSWVDYFLFGDVSIIGQGLNLCEIDLWWLISCKKKNGCGSITHFEPKISMENKLLTETYGMGIVSDNVEPDGFKDYYSRLLKDIIP